MRCAKIHGDGRARIQMDTRDNFQDYFPENDQPERDQKIEKRLLTGDDGSDE